MFLKLTRECDRMYARQRCLVINIFSKGDFPMSKRLKSVIVSALLLSMTATAVTPVCNASALNAADTAIAVDALNLTYQEDGKTVRTIGGEISAAKISSESDAKTILTGLADQLGVTDFDAQLRFLVKEESEINDSYVYQQYVGNIPLDSGFVTLVVNKETKNAVYLTSSFAADLEISTTPVVAAFQARTIVKKELGTEPDGIADLTIAKTRNGYQLAWLITNGQMDAFYVDAQTGEIIKSMNNNNYTYQKTLRVTQYNNIARRSNFSIPFRVEDSQGKHFFKLHDDSRGLYIVTSPFSAVNSSMGQLWGTSYDGKTYSNEAYMRSFPWVFDAHEFGRQVIANMVSSDSTSNDVYNGNPEATGALFRVGQVYDFYKSYFSWYGIDNCGTNIYITPYERNKTSAQVNAFSSTFGNLIGFGTNSNGLSLMADLDIVAHEYQHSVSNRKVKWGFSGFTGYTGETLILDEGYADVLGEYCDILKDGASSSEWLGGKDALYSGSTNDQALIKDFKAELPSNLNYLNYSSNFYNRIEGHEGSKVVSHAAYLMHKYGVPDKYAAKIWFYSMDYLPKGADAATFYDWRSAIEQAANDILNSAYSNVHTRNLMKARILMAFNAVHLPARTSKPGDANGNMQLDNGDLNYLNQYLSGARELDAFALSLCDVNLDGKVNNTDATWISQALQYNWPLRWT